MLTHLSTFAEYNRLELLKLVREIDSKRIDVAVNGGLTDNFEKPGRYEVINSEENLQNGLQVVKISGSLNFYNFHIHEEFVNFIEI